jgi:hypothetical protein
MAEMEIPDVRLGCQFFTRNRFQHGLNLQQGFFSLCADNRAGMDLKFKTGDCSISISSRRVHLSAAQMEGMPF